jgi:hypothetical protein
MEEGGYGQDEREYVLVKNDGTKHVTNKNEKKDGTDADDQPNKNGDHLFCKACEKFGHQHYMSLLC